MWSALLGAFDIKYMPSPSVKGQVLADLVAEFAEPSIETMTGKKDWVENWLAQFQLGAPCIGRSTWMARPTKEDQELE